MKKSKKNEWRVTYKGGFWSQHGRRGTELSIGKSFQWGEQIWRIPAVYTCGDGLIVDFCIEVDPDRIKRFLDKWYPILLENPNLTGGLHKKMEAENPTSLPHFRCTVTVNSSQLREEGACSITWIPDHCAPEPMGDRFEARCVLEHYGLDSKMGWIFYRARLPWTTKRKPDIKHITLTLEQQPQRICGEEFSTPAIGDSLSFPHPITGITHTLTVTDVRQGEIKKPVHFTNVEKWPGHHITMEYTLSPDLTNRQFSIRDTAESDQPIMKLEPARPDGAASIGIIGGADGPTAVIFSHKEESARRSAISSLHFEPVGDVVWQLEFREKLTEDLTITLM